MSVLLVPAPVKRIGAAAKLKLQGLVLFATVFALIALTVLFYNHAFTKVDYVTLKTDSIGHQLIVPADVKLRGVIVGQVRGVSSDGNVARMKIALEPNKVASIPRNVEARILPKTLFGEKFVDLVAPSNPSPDHIRAGDVIQQDRSQTAIETERVFDDLLPVLQAVKPAELNITLSNIADALRGQGSALGDNLSRNDDYFKAFNPHLPTLQTDISGLADMADNYNRAAPDLLTMLRNFSFNARTTVAKQAAFHDLLTSTTSFADTATQVFSENETNLITLASVSRPTLSVLARYSPEFTCLIQGLDKIEPLLDSTFNPQFPGRRRALHIVLQVVKQPSGYTYPKDAPRYKDDQGPNCRGLPGAQNNYYTIEGKGGKYPPSGTSSAASAFDFGTPVNPQDQRVIDTIATAGLGHPAPAADQGIANLLAGPMMRGMEVSLS